jgi:hypothetical protein
MRETTTARAAFGERFWEFGVGVFEVAVPSYGGEL